MLTQNDIFEAVSPAVVLMNTQYHCKGAVTERKVAEPSMHS